MPSSSAYKVRSEIIERNMPRVKGNNQYKAKTVVALDGGYSSVKGVGPGRVFMFPSYAKKAPAGLEAVGKVKPEDIRFRDNKTGDIWLVGQSAEALMDQRDIDATTDANMYGRYRYDSDMYKVVMSTGMALGLWGTPADREVFLQTGLPSKYKNADKSKLIAALSGDYDVSLKVGDREWATFVFSLDAEHIDVIEQPQGTLLAVAYDNGEMSKVGAEVMSSNTIIDDIGFGTEDVFAMTAGYKLDPQTFTDTAMKSVFERVLKDIEKNESAEFKVFELQNYLDEGTLPCFNPTTTTVDYVDFTKLLESANEALCEKSVKRLLEEYDNLIKYKYLIVTGGTGESRFEKIKEMLSGLKGLKVVPGNMNTPDLSCAYSNVVGYYMYRHAKESAEARKSAG